MTTRIAFRLAGLLAAGISMLVPFATLASAQQIMSTQQIVRKLRLNPETQNAIAAETPQRNLRAPAVKRRVPQQQGEGGVVVMRRAPQAQGEAMPTMRAPQPEIIVQEQRAPQPKKKVAKARSPQPDTKVAVRRAPQPDNNNGPKTAKGRAPQSETGGSGNTQIASVDENSPNAVRGIEVREIDESRAADAYPDRGRIDLEILFEYDSAKIDPKSVKQLIALGDALNDPQLGAGRFMIAGHTDAAGGDSYNAELSLRRAEAVSQFLTDFAGVSGERLAIEGYGEEKLKYPDAPESGQNRRVEIINMGDAG